MVGLFQAVDLVILVGIGQGAASKVFPFNCRDVAIMGGGIPNPLVREVPVIEQFHAKQVVAIVVHVVGSQCSVVYRGQPAPDVVAEIHRLHETVGRAVQVLFHHLPQGIVLELLEQCPGLAVDLVHLRQHPASVVIYKLIGNGNVPLVHRMHQLTFQQVAAKTVGIGNPVTPKGFR